MLPHGAILYTDGCKLDASVAAVDYHYTAVVENQSFAIDYCCMHYFKPILNADQMATNIVICLQH